MTHRTLATGLLALALVSQLSHAEETLLGARSLIAKLKEADTQPTSKGTPASAAKAARMTLGTDLRAYAATSQTMAPAAAAKRWLELFDGCVTLPPPTSRHHYYGGESFDPFSPASQTVDPAGISMASVIAALPGPAAWSALQTAVDARPETTPAAKQRKAALQILTALLREQLSSIDKEVDALAAPPSASVAFSPFASPHGEYAQRELETVRDAIRETVGFSSKEAVVANFSAALAEAAKATEGRLEFEVPDLCRLTSDEQARALLRKVVLSKTIQPKVPAGGKTLELLKQIVLEEMEHVTRPNWELVSSPDDMALYEALDRKFPRKDPVVSSAATRLFTRSSHDPFRQQGASLSRYRTQATTVYLVGLIANGRIEEAVALAKSKTSSANFSTYNLRRLPGLNRTEFSQNCFVFLEQVLDDLPASPWWGIYPEIALMARQSEVALERLERTLAQPELEVGLRIAHLKQKSALDFGLGNTAAGIAGLRALCAVDFSSLGKDAIEQASQTVLATSLTLASIGHLLERPALLDEGIAAAKQAVADAPNSQRYGGGWYQSASLVDVLVAAERYAEAEALILEAMTTLLSGPRDDGSGFPGMGGSLQSPVNLSEPLTALVILYDKLERPADVWFLLQEVPWWQSPVLPLHESKLVVAASKSMAHAGRREDAIKLLKHTILLDPGSDAAYEALLALEPTDMIEWLDELYARDRFEERPLIWKAVLLKQDGKLEKAEATIRHALKVDPTDGETEAGQRVMAYQVLAEVLELQGKDDDAAFFRSVVRSVRTAEKGDQFSEAGLISESLKLYERAEGDFADAYCVQWRLAERLHALGRYEEAEAHYEIAFKRMPEQFGRVASFCFGCSGVFAKEHSRSVAERILVQLLEDHGDNPQVHFLLGQLRKAQGKQSAAYDHFTRAVELDPKYLDAWERVYSLSRSLFLPKSETDAMGIRALELDPLQRHFSARLDQTAAIGKMWTTMQANLHLWVPEVEITVELAAAKKQMEELAGEGSDAMRRQQQRQRRYMHYGSQRMNPARPGRALLDHVVVQRLINIVK